MDIHGHVKLARTLSDLLDNKFGVGKLRFGLDPILGVIPGIGDIIPTVLSFYIVWIGIQLGMPQERIARMIGNIVTDFLIGIIPIVGDVADAFYKSNSKNMKVIEEFLDNVVEGKVLKTDISHPRN